MSRQPTLFDFFEEENFPLAWENVFFPGKIRLRNGIFSEYFTHLNDDLGNTLPSKKCSPVSR